jgi:two-component system response regulator HydG
MAKILVIDDNRDVCLLLQRFLSKHNFQIEISHTGKAGLDELKKNSYDLVLCDFRLPDMDGLEMIPEIKSIRPNCQIVIITGYSDVKMAVKVMKRGAFEYVTKPIFPEEILHTVKQALLIAEAHPKKVKTKNNTVSQKQVNPKHFSVSYARGESARANQLEKMISLVAPTDITVVITGESGTGKEVAAKRIHENSSRKNEKLIAVDCGALPKELAGSILFGHVKGSFTGAVKAQTGHFESAHKGTLFLDEIGNLSYENQVKLLRVLQERKIQKIGDSSTKSIDVRVIAATNENLKEKVEKGEFREDLFYRLNEFNIELPSLRERQEDIEEISIFLLKKACEELNKSVSEIDKQVIDIFKKYNWPGNIRELKNVVKRATLVTTTKKITKADIPVEIQNPKLFLASEESPSNMVDLKSVVEDAEKRAILKTLKSTGFNKSKTAEVLKVDRKTLYNKIKAYKIELPS